MPYIVACGTRRLFRQEQDASGRCLLLCTRSTMQLTWQARALLVVRYQIFTRRRVPFRTLRREQNVTPSGAIQSCNLIQRESKSTCLPGNVLAIYICPP
jgi:hypothetical protein